MNPNFNYEKMNGGGDPYANPSYPYGPAPGMRPGVPVDQLEGYAYRERMARGDISLCENMQFKALEPKFVSDLLQNGLYPKQCFSILGVLVTIGALVSIGLQTVMIFNSMTMHWFCTGFLVGGIYLAIQVTVFMTIKTQNPSYVRTFYIMSTVGLIVASLSFSVNIIAALMPCGYGNISKDCSQSSLIYLNIAEACLDSFYYTVSMVQVLMLRKRLYKTMEKFGYPPRPTWLN